MTTTLSAVHSDAAFDRKRKALLVYPCIVIPFLAALFWILGGGRGGQAADPALTTQTGLVGFNAQIPTATHGSIDDRDIQGPGYAKADPARGLSIFTSVRSTSAVTTPTGATTALAPLTAAAPVSSLAPAPRPAYYAPVATPRSRSPRTSYARSGRTGAPTYYYNAPGSTPTKAYYGATDQQLDRQLQQYEQGGTAAPVRPRVASVPQPERTAERSTERTATVRLSDEITASRLAESAERENPFMTAPTGGSRPLPTAAVLSGGGYGTKKTVALLIPVVVHESQTIRDGQQVKLRLLREIKADGVTIPVNTILYAHCQLSDDRLRLTVQNLQLGGQLIPLDLDVYDTDGTAGVNVPGLEQNGGVGGQIRSSAIQGIQVPGLGGLGNAVLNSARQGVSQSARQTSIRLRAGYNLFLKAQ